jgi:hypothetical protein
MIQSINPYIAGMPVQGEKFFGRKEILRWIERELCNPATNGLVIFSQRRIGRTSILLQLQRTLPTDDFLPVYFDLQYQAARPLGQVLADLIDATAWRANLEPPDLDASDDQGRFFRREFLPQLHQALGENRRPVFLLDEFDVLDQPVEAKSEATATRTFFPFLRRVMTEDPRPAFVFAVGRWLEDLSLNFTAIFKHALAQEVWVLDQKDAEALVRQAEANNTLRFTDEAIARILSLTSGHPFFTQLLCQRIWEQAYAPNPSMLPQIDVAAVDAAVPDALDASSQALIWLWNGLSQVEKICTAALAEIASEKETISANQIIQALTDYAAQPGKSEMTLAPHTLVKRRLLEQVGEYQYRFAVELLRRWTRQNKPLRDVRDELNWMTQIQTQAHTAAATKVLTPTPLPSAPTWTLTSGDHIGRYQIESKRGDGAMGIVYKAYDPNINRFVALKVLRPIPGPRAGELEERFRREAQAAGKLEHPNIVTVYDADVVEGQWYIVMEYLEGKTLAEIVAQEGARPLEWVTDIMTQTCAALNYAHEHQVVHRDVKPSNIMVLEDDRVKMTDFGLASITADSDLTNADAFLGTPCYMSPEQIRAPKQVDGRSDIFSLGAVAYELLTGELLFPDKHITLIYQIISPEPVDLGNSSASLPEPIRQVLEKALAKDVSERFSTCAEFSEAFVHAVECVT